MNQENAVPERSAHELNISRLVDVSPEVLYRCWTDPELVVQWFTPAPWKTASCENDLRVGGRNEIVMESPEGERFPNQGIFLVLDPPHRIVVTDALLEGWIPSEKPFMVSEMTFEREGDQTRYTARANHWNPDDCQNHRNMGFYEGWNKALDQLLEVAGRM